MITIKKVIKAKKVVLILTSDIFNVEAIKLKVFVEKWSFWM